MKRFSDFLLPLLLSLFLAACHGEEEWNTTSSGFLISLANEEVTVASRATPSEIGKPVAENFHLRITSHKTGSAIYDASYTSGIIPASAGMYSLMATYGENPALAWDSPYYEGNEETEVATNRTTSVSLTCKVANSLLSVKFKNPEQFDTFYSSYFVKVKSGNLSLSIHRQDEEAKKSAYFRAGSAIELEFHATLKENGKEVSMKIANDQLPATYEAGTHVTLTLSAAIPASGTILTVDKVETEKVTVSETIPLEWLPKPKVNGFGGESHTLTYTETADAPSGAAISYTASSPVQDVKFTLDFKDAQYTTYNKEYLLSEMTADERTALSGIGITLPTIDGTSKEGTIDVNALTANLITDAGTEVLNTIKVNVKANNRWSSESGEEYRIKVVKPEFSVSVQPGSCWTKEFTIDEITVATGNAEKIKKSLVYQYSEDGGTTWQDCNDMTVKFSDAPTNKNYKVKACFRGEINSNNIADATLETPKQLPNSDMEEWYIEEKKKTGTLSSAKTYYTFHPYADGASTASWWDTNNDLAQGGTLALGIWYQGCFASCVSYTEDAHDGSKAALMYLSGCGNSYANTAGTYLGGAMVGSLFIGSYNSGIQQGHDFPSRPMSLSFWYKYKPYNSDAFKVIISLKNGDEEIASGSYEPTAYSAEDSSYQQATVDFVYKTTSKKATTICVQFLASNKSSLKESDFIKGTTINYPIIGDWTVHMGSILKIDALSLNYTK